MNSRIPFHSPLDVPSGAYPVSVSLTSKQSTREETADPVSMMTNGYVIRNEEEACWSVVYQETEVTGMEGTTTIISLFDDQVVRLKRVGSVQMNLVFREGSTHTSYMSTPYGMMDLNVVTSRAGGKLSEAGGRIELAYSLTFRKQDTVSTALELIAEPVVKEDSLLS